MTGGATVMPSAERLAIMRDRLDRGDPADVFAVWIELRYWAARAGSL